MRKNVILISSLAAGALLAGCSHNAAHQAGSAPKAKAPVAKQAPVHKKAPAPKGGYGNYSVVDDNGTEWSLDLSKAGDPTSKLAVLTKRYQQALSDTTPLVFMTLVGDNTDGDDSAVSMEPTIVSGGKRYDTEAVGDFIEDIASLDKNEDAVTSDPAFTIDHQIADLELATQQILPGTKVSAVYVLKATSIPEPSAVYINGTQLLP